jgi:hypothetical protein
MNTPLQPFQQVPMEGVRMEVQQSAPAQSAGEPPKSVIIPFQEIRHLLTGRPLRRPNRTRPAPATE